MNELFHLGPECECNRLPRPGPRALRGLYGPNNHPQLRPGARHGELIADC